MGRKKKYHTEEERKEAHRIASQKYKKNNRDKIKQYYQEHKEEIAEWGKRYRKENKKEVFLRKQQYYQEHKEEIAEKQKQYYQEHKEKHAELGKKYRQEHKEELAEYMKQYLQTPIGRATMLYNAYCRHDKNANRGECTLTPEWIVDNIFTQKCHWCPETDWRELGCDRIDNSLPHTPDNVIPCCERCNKKRGRKTYDEYKKALTEQI